MKNFHFFIRVIQRFSISRDVIVELGALSLSLRTKKIFGVLAIKKAELPNYVHCKVGSRRVQGSFTRANSVHSQFLPTELAPNLPWLSLKVETPDIY